MSELPYKICLSMDDLSQRHEKIPQLLSPLIKRSDSIYVLLRPVGTEEFVISALQSGVRGVGEYRDWKFKTVVDGILGTYFERWIKFYNDDEEVLYYMDRAYLHLNQIIDERRPPCEYVLLHCDPNETREHSLYKKSPHLHIHAAPDPWPHAHIALNVGYLEPMLASSEALTDVFSAAILMLKEQVLDEL